MVVVGSSMGVWSDQQGMLVGSRRKLMRVFGLQHAESHASEGSRCRTDAGGVSLRCDVSTSAATQCRPSLARDADDGHFDTDCTGFQEPAS